MKSVNRLYISNILKMFNITRLLLITVLIESVEKVSLYIGSSRATDGLKLVYIMGQVENPYVSIWAF